MQARWLLTVAKAKRVPYAVLAGGNIANSKIQMIYYGDMR